ncbi:MAG: 3-deoxy-8-phosphooctulonate synthase [Deltaproteobacteria bacterium]|nr:3-deoxy-8-phosphooctulonate synthase [Deltaproteobacteria bacterium]
MSLAVAHLSIGEGQPLALIAGPCVLEDLDETLFLAEALARLAGDTPLIFKASFDKANRTSRSSYRGPGLDLGLEWLARVKAETGLPLTTDIHLPEQAAVTAEVVDLLQIPAFLARQTDLLVAAGATGLPVNLKKGQFLAPSDMGHAREKALSAGASGVMLTERGASFGYGDLVVDLRSIPRMAALGSPVCFDATHSTQRPGALGDRSGGDASLAPRLAMAAVVMGAHAVFAEVHPDPARARSDAATQLALGDFAAFLRGLRRAAEAR